MGKNERHFELDRNVEIIIFEDNLAIIRLINSKYSIPLSNEALNRLEKVLKWI